MALRKERRQFVAYKLTRIEAPYLEGVISFVYFSKLLLLFIYLFFNFDMENSLLVIILANSQIFSH